VTIALLRSIVEGNGYNPHIAIKHYLHWGNSGQTMMGRNTSQLFKGVKTEKGYINRFTEINGTDPFSPFVVMNSESESKQSNGALMRCLPIACLVDWEKALIADCHLTNPSCVAYWCEYLYIIALRLLFQDKPPKEVFEHILSISSTAPEQVLRCLNSVRNNVSFPHQKKEKGWVCVAFYYAMLALTHSEQGYENFMAYVIRQGGDADTNALISGAIMGAIVGYNNLITNPITRNNLEIMIRSISLPSDIPRPREYYLTDLPTLLEALYPKCS
jgi:ADP-ribosylglycohydrolase